jgi:hypothetical protein
MKLPHFPALRSDPTALSGASRRKQNPCSRHIADAIRINRERKPVYAMLTRGTSHLLSHALIGFEQGSKLPAIWLDRWAKKFWARGINILIDDFMPMDGLKSPFQPPLYRGRLSEAGHKRLKGILSEFRKAFVRTTLNKDFRGAARCSHETLKVVIGVERQEGCHLAMVRHILESFGFSALHAIGYSRQSQGATESLSKTFLLVQALLFAKCIWFDLEAQKSHQLGVGILVNDLPAIPFEEEWDAFSVGSPPK